ncbi:hypothetical protein [Paenibacillus ginsengarvi]|nr:hypothetical protein [Paenibacillus ginsengarvi]
MDVRRSAAANARERDFPSKKAELAFEKSYLQENDFVRTFLLSMG